MTRNELKQIIVAAYEAGTTITEAEKYAALFLSAQMEISEELRESDLNRRMRKRGLKTLKSAIRTDEISKHDKKPTEGILEDVVNLSKLVEDEELAFDAADIEFEALERDFGIFKDAHIYFRGVAKGSFGS